MGLKITKENENFDIIMYDNLKDIKLLRKMIELWLEESSINEFKIMSVKLCIDESVYNSFLHAYKNNPGKKKIVRIKIYRKKNKVHLFIQDNGSIDWYKNYKKTNYKNKKDLIKMHGRGLIIMEKLAQSLKVINKPNKGTTLQMSIDLSDKTILI